VNGVLAAPLMAVMMVIAMNKRIMGRLTRGIPLVLIGGAATIVMAVASVGFFVL
jgi:hypothetical protein